MDALTINEAAETTGWSPRMLRYVERSDEALRSATDDWFEAQPERPEHVPVPDWLRWEQEKHQRLLTTTTPLTEVA